MTIINNYVNHIALVLDASGSMQFHRDSLIKAADAQIAHLARRSKELNQETRVSVYVFNNDVKCVIWDMDVLRLPSVKSFYGTSGMTALMDATLKTHSDLKEIPQRYGDHSFLMFVLTDGQDNASQAVASQLLATLQNLEENWTVGAMVPDIQGIADAKHFGFPANNIAIWNTSSAQGAEEAVSVIQKATDTYMMGRASGLRSSKALFSTGAATVNKGTVASLNLKPLSPSKFMLVPVPTDTVIKDFVEATGRTYQVGKAFYQLMKRETIQANKQLAVVEKKTAKVYLGDGVRDLLGLPEMEVRAQPESNPDYTIFVQSTAINRKLIAGTKVLLLND